MYMGDKVSENIIKAFSEESKAAARFKAFAFQARKDDRDDLARLFGAVAQAKAVQARRFLGHLKGKIGSSDENLKEALEKEEKNLVEFYPAMAEEAVNAPWAVQKAFKQTMKVSSRHLDLFRKASEGGLGGSRLYVCRICGYISEGSIPENCPVCHAVRGRFTEVE
jgi:rubrerythrin